MKVRKKDHPASDNWKKCLSKYLGNSPKRMATSMNQATTAIFNTTSKIWPPNPPIKRWQFTSFDWKSKNVNGLRKRGKDGMMFHKNRLTANIPEKICKVNSGCSAANFCDSVICDFENLLGSNEEVVVDSLVNDIEIGRLITIYENDK
uniref:Uncharacterized protein n=1 Tax=Romanomermis culicivorax TaxID=13658 RepID=A0A915J1D6_ROMCU